MVEKCFIYGDYPDVGSIVAIPKIGELFGDLLRVQRKVISGKVGKKVVWGCRRSFFYVNDDSRSSEKEISEDRREKNLL